MDDTAGVREGDRVADAVEQPQAIRQRQARRVRVEPLAADEAHHQEDAPVGEPSDVVHRHDAGVLERGERPRFARQPGRVRRRPPRRHLDGDVAIELAIARAKDEAHAAAADFVSGLVARRRRSRDDRRAGAEPIERAVGDFVTAA